MKLNNPSALSGVAYESKIRSFSPSVLPKLYRALSDYPNTPDALKSAKDLGSAKSRVTTIELIPLSLARHGVTRSTAATLGTRAMSTMNSR
jgi:hypothetical protein